jgi:hypothetical protein
MDDCQIAILPINGWMKGKLTMERLVSWAYLRNGWLSRQLIEMQNSLTGKFRPA